MRVLIACEYSGITRDAFTRFGWDAWSCDLLPTESPGNHVQGDVTPLLTQGWDLLIGHPPCTYLSNAGSEHFRDKRIDGYAQAEVSGQARWLAMHEGCAFFNLLWTAPVPRIAIENPIPMPEARVLVGNYSQVIHPWQFGHNLKKPTCLWLKNLPLLEPTFIRKDRNAFIDKIGGADRKKRRAKSFTGIADAMAAQWTLAFLDSPSLVQ